MASKLISKAPKADTYIDGNGYETKRKPRAFRPVKLKETRKKAKLTLQRCDGCGAEKEAKGRTWCDCNPSAPWRMTPIRIIEIVDETIKKNLEKQG